LVWSHSERSAGSQYSKGSPKPLMVRWLSILFDIRLRRRHDSCRRSIELTGCEFEGDVVSIADESERQLGIEVDARKIGRNLFPAVRQSARLHWRPCGGEAYRRVPGSDNQHQTARLTRRPGASSSTWRADGRRPSRCLCGRRPRRGVRVRHRTAPSRWHRRSPQQPARQRRRPAS